MYCTILMKQRIDPLNVNIEVRSSSLILSQSLQNKIDSELEIKQIESRLYNKKMFNGLTYRLEEIKSIDQNNWLLSISPIYYKERYILEQWYKNKVNIDLIKSMGMAIGGFVKTTDNYYIVGELSNKSLNDKKNIL
jgi:hypothetical protein